MMLQFLKSSTEAKGEKVEANNFFPMILDISSPAQTYRLQHSDSHLPRVFISSPEKPAAYIAEAPPERKEITDNASLGYPADFASRIKEFATTSRCSTRPFLKVNKHRDPEVLK